MTTSSCTNTNMIAALVAKKEEWINLKKQGFEFN